MLDHIKDKKEAEDWLNNTSHEYMTVEAITDLVKKGFITCEPDSFKTGSFCASRKYSPEDACICIRTIFPSPEYYELYKRAREFYLNTVALKIIASPAGKGTVVHEEKNERDRSGN